VTKPTGKPIGRPRSGEADETVVLRVPTALLEAAESLVPVMDAELHQMGTRASRSSVLRAALATGLEVLAKRYGKRRGTKAPMKKP
jgi:hypothetical protein